MALPNVVPIVQDEDEEETGLVRERGRERERERERDSERERERDRQNFIIVHATIKGACFHVVRMHVRIIGAFVLSHSTPSISIPELKQLPGTERWRE